MSLVALEDDVDANITHFGHRDDFLKLLASLLQHLDDHDEKNLDEPVTSMGAIVSRLSSQPADASSTNIYLSLAC
jgi:hypothetical protein